MVTVEPTKLFPIDNCSFATVDYMGLLDENITVDGCELQADNLTRLCSQVTHDHCEIVCLFSRAGNVIGILSIVLNFAFLTAMYSSRDRSTPYNILVQNMSVADILACLTFLLTKNWPQGPFAPISRSRSLFLAYGLPYVFRSMPWMFFTAYFLTLTALTVSHYMAVCQPWKYAERQDQGHVSKALVGVWLLSSLQIIVPIIVLSILCTRQDKQEAMKTLYKISGVEMNTWIGIFAASIIVNIILDVLVYRKLKQLRYARRSSGYLSRERRNICNKHHMFVTVSLFIITSVLCRLPFPLVGIYGMNLTGVTAHRLYVINAVVILLLYVNFFADPVLYVIRMKDIRSFYVRNLNKCFHVLCKKSSTEGIRVSSLPASGEGTRPNNGDGKAIELKEFSNGHLESPLNVDAPC